MAEELKNLKYLKFNERTRTFSLRESHAYYFQVMGCLGLPGTAWIEATFFVYCPQQFHSERIYFDAGVFSEMLKRTLTHFISTFTYPHQFSFEMLGNISQFSLYIYFLIHNN